MEIEYIRTAANLQYSTIFQSYFSFSYPMTEKRNEFLLLCGKIMAFCSRIFMRNKYFPVLSAGL